jgi:hypothetical protein
MTTLQMLVPSFTNMMHSLFQSVAGLARACSRTFIDGRLIRAQGTDEAMANATITLDANQRRLFQKPAETLIACVGGSLVISQPGGSHNLLLRAGETYFVRRNATLHVLAEQDAQVRFSRAGKRRLFSADLGWNRPCEWTGDTRADLAGSEQSWRSIHFAETVLRGGISPWGL